MKPLSNMPLFIAHRGAPYYAPENTLASFAEAHALGATWVECDVMLTKDDHAIIMHDATLERTTNGSGAVADHTLADIQSLNAGQGEEVPTLESFLKEAARLGLGINLEIKERAVNAERIADKIHQALKMWWPSSSPQPLISSSESACLKAYRRRDSMVAMAYITDRWPLFCLHRLRHLDVSAIVINQHALTQKRIMKLHEAGYRVLAYTINNLDDMKRLIKWRVDGLFTDDYQAAEIVLSTNVVTHC